MQHIKVLCLIGFISGLSGFLLLFTLVDTARVYELQDYKPPLPTKILDRKGRLISTYFNDNRILIKLKDTPKHLAQAFIATEDNHFYSHHGLDLQAILRAFLINLQFGGVKQGGSTITQQLAKVVLTDRKRTYVRKAKEAVLAIYMETFLTKKEILTLYFNQIYLGHGNYGIEAASKFYFNKSVSKLRIGESAILASLPSAPNGNSPFKRPKRSMNKLKHILMKMIDLGFITKKKATEEYSDMVQYYAHINVSPTSTAFGLRIDKAPYYTESLRRMLIKDLGKKLLYEGGLTIKTGLDLDHQKAAQDSLWPALRKQNNISRQYIFNHQDKIAAKFKNILSIVQLNFDLPEFSIKRSYDQYRMQLYFHEYLTDKLELLNLSLENTGEVDTFLQAIRDKSPYLNRYQSVQGAMVEIDNATGEVTAMIGGLPFSSQNQINRAMQMKRQPGSAFKPLIYAAAIENKKISASTIFPDSPVVFLNAEGESWMPKNYSGGYRGFISVRDALAYSTNLVSVAVAREAGLGNILPTIAKQLHIPTNTIPHNLSVALGTFEVSPLQLATAFAVFPRGGKSVTAILVKKVINNEGKVIRDYETAAKIKKKEEQILSLGTATIMSELMQGVISRGTGSRARSAGYKGYAAGKTGTTQNYRDAWFGGFNDRYTTVLWMGYDMPSLSLGPGQAGGNIAAPVWGKYQVKVLPYRKDEKPYLKSGGVTRVKICKLSGKLPSERCNDIVEEIFLPDSIPEEHCEEPHGLTAPVSTNTSSINEKNVNDDMFYSKDDI